MKILVEQKLSDFEFWSGALDRTSILTLEQLDQMEDVLEDLYPDGISDTQINDIFWFEEDWVAEQLGFKDFEHLEAHNEFEKSNIEEVFLAVGKIDDEEEKERFNELRTQYIEDEIDEDKIIGEAEGFEDEPFAVFYEKIPEGFDFVAENEEYFLLKDVNNGDFVLLKWMDCREFLEEDEERGGELSIMHYEK